MLKKVVAYQKLMLNSILPVQNQGKPVLGSMLSGFFFAALWILLYFIGINNMTFILPFVSVWVIYRIFDGDRRLFELVPVTPMYTIFNTYLLAFVMMIFGYIGVLLTFGVLIGFIMAIVLASGGEILQGPPEGVTEVVSSGVNSLIFFLLLFLLIIFVGTTISLIKGKKLKRSLLAASGVVLYGFLYTLKQMLPPILIHDRFDFETSFDLAPNSETILIGFGIITAIAIPLLVITGYRLYSSKPSKYLY